MSHLNLLLKQACENSKNGCKVHNYAYDGYKQRLIILKGSIPYFFGGKLHIYGVCFIMFGIVNWH